MDVGGFCRVSAFGRNTRRQTTDENEEKAHVLALGKEIVVPTYST